MTMKFTCANHKTQPYTARYIWCSNCSLNGNKLPRISAHTNTHTYRGKICKRQSITGFIFESNVNINPITLGKKSLASGHHHGIVSAHQQFPLFAFLTLYNSYLLSTITQVSPILYKFGSDNKRGHDS